MTLENEVGAPLPDLSQCDSEPIHVPGAIQPHGVLLVLHGPQLQIIQTTSTCQALLGIAPSELLERELATVLGPALAAAVHQAQVQYRELPHAPSSFDWQPPPGDRTCVGHVHTSERFTILELETAPTGPAAPGEVLAQAVLGFSAVHDEPRLPDKLQIAAALFRRLTGYDRVMIYRFDADWHGEVIAEARRADLEPYLGLHYPATDIPIQARRLYLINPTRVIVDIDYVPSPLLPGLNPVSGQPLDLSRSLLRSVSPVHLEYLRNMGVRATLTTSLCREDQLWGLIACHHDSPRRVSGAIRQIADWLGQYLVTEIALAEDISRRRDETHRKECRGRIISAMRQGTRLAALLNGPQLPDLLGAIGADGVALMSGTQVTTGGVTPAPPRIVDLVARLSAEHAKDPSHLFATECLSEHLAGTHDLAATAAGVVLIPLDEEQTIKLIWFRGEYVRTVTWGGDPDKAVDLDPRVRLSPRQSFAAWTQMVRLRSRRWDPDELESVRKLGTLIDIEWRKVAEEALREADRRKDEFLAMLGHELRNPLAPIRHVADVLTLNPTLERVPWAADILTRQVSHLVRLVDDLLDVARINRGKLALHRQRFDLREALERAMEQALPLLDNHTQRLDVALAPTLVTVDGDPERLTQVIVNLLGNAAKFSPPDRTVFLTLDTVNGAARIQVRDQGIGIAASLLPRLFTPFTQGEQTLDRPRGGLGLGLALVKGLVELHGGQVQATSPGPGSGSTFTVQLPLAPSAPAAAASYPDRRIKKRVILVVDDDPDVAAACAMLLSCLGQEVHTAHDGVVALDLVERLQPELILLDIGLPDMNGYEVARRLRTTGAGRAAQLVALTGYGQEDDRQRALAAGFDEHLCKPVEVKTLINVLERDHYRHDLLIGD